MTAAKKPEPPARPTSLRIGPFTWKVTWDIESWSTAFDGTVQGDEPDALRSLGMCDKRWSIIYMNPHNAETYLRETLAHEVLHACQFVADLPNTTPCRGEDFITRITPIFLDTLKRNPELLAYITYDD